MRLEMARIEILGLKTHLNATVHALHRLGCVQIDPFGESAGPAVRALRLDRETARAQEELAFLLARLEGLLAVLGPPPPRAAEGAGAARVEDDARAGLETLAPQVQALVARRDVLEAERASLPRYEATLRKLLPIVPASARNPANVTIGVLLSRSHLAAFDGVIERIMDLSASQAEIVSEDVDAATRAILIVVPRAHATATEGLLGKQDISRLRLPGDLAGQAPDAAVAALAQRLAAIPHELQTVTDELAALARQWSPRLAAWQAALRERTDEYGVLARLGETDYTFMLSGWTPARDVARVRTALAEVAGEAVVLQVMPVTHAETARAPVALDNPALARPFESLVRLLALPRYDGIDPTPLMAFFLPLFFGMILGDVGYGSVLLGLSIILLRNPRFNHGVAGDVVHVLAYGSAWAIVFGFLYGELFGTLGEALGLHALWLDRASPDQVGGLLLFSISVGVIHVTLGLLIGLWEAVRERRRDHLLERGGMLVGLAGLFLIVATVVKWLPAGFMTPGLAIVIVGIVMLSASFGRLLVGVAAGPIEFVGVVGNILSYMRIAAIGLASVYLARVANEVGESAGQVHVVLGVIVAVLIHALNLVMGAFSPTIHSLRLHYVEFFRKFYEGGGRPFEPFGRIR
jgi:V/A-type H+-transporting ATPase subunit I